MRSKTLESERPTSAYSFDLPQAQMKAGPGTVRGEAKLLVLERDSGRIRHRRIADLPEYVDGRPVFANNSALLPGWMEFWRMPGHVESFYFIEPSGPRRWKTFSLLEPNDWKCRFLTKDGSRVLVSPDGDTPRRYEVEFLSEVDPRLEGRFRVPPDYLPRPTLHEVPLAQALYAKVPGSFAAPTAGVHLTEDLLAKLNVRELTLHTGPTSFYDVREERPSEYRMGPEWYRIPVPPALGEKVLAVGSTTAKALEAWARTGVTEGWSDLFIHPPFEWKAVGALLTNLQRPRQTLLIMICALAGYEAAMEAHREAVRQGYSFSYYGDLMLIL